MLRAMLTAQQIAAREGKLTGSRVAALMHGEPERVLQLYNEMIGAAVEDDLTAVWPVRLGALTEQLNLEWFERRNGPISRRGEVVVHPAIQWAAATLDAWADDLKCPIECKHVAGREPLEVIIDRYQPQMQWQMLVTNAKQCALSVIIGANEPVVEFIERADDYIIEMAARGEQFMKFVARREPPVVLPPVPAPCDPTKLIDMTGNNRWATFGADWIVTKPISDRCRDAEKILKEMVPADAKRVSGHGIQITRDRAGRLSLRAT